MTPIDCMKLQLDRRFSCTLGCAELESIGRRVLLDLCAMNRWDSWLRRSDYTDKETDEDGSSFWAHGHWIGSTAYECSFGRYVTYSTDGKLFQVNQSFIDAMHFSEMV